MPNKFGSQKPPAMRSLNTGVGVASKQKAAIDQALINSMSEDAKNYKGTPVQDLVDRNILGNKIRKSRPQAKPAASMQRMKGI